jgi:hypothetical protein
MKLRSPAIAFALLATLASHRVSTAQDAGTWRPAVTRPAAVSSAPSADANPNWQPAIVQPAAEPAMPMLMGPGWQPAVYGGLPTPMYLPANYASYASYGAGCTDCGAVEGACGCSAGCDSGRNWLSERFGIYGTWGSVEFMHAWAKARSAPPLITTGPTGAARPAAGVLPAATTLFGGDDKFGDDRQSAGRIVVGGWLDPCENLGVGLRLFAIEGDNSGLHRFSDGTGDPILGVPFFDLQLAAEGAFLAAFPGELDGEITARTSQDVFSGELSLRALLARGNGYRLDLVGGYHYTLVSDGLDLINSSTNIDPGGVFPIGTTFVLTDRFDARNDFHGASSGLMGELRHGCWRLHSLGKISVGNVRQVITISGDTVTTVPGSGVSVDQNGMFTQQSNIGTFSRDRTTYVPEAAFTLGYQVNNCLELTVGYSFMYWAHVVQAGDHIDRVVDLSQAGGGPVAARPAVTLRDTDFWVQGVTLGLNFEY